MTNDANTAALNKKERADAANDAIVDAYQERAIEELVDDIMRGETRVSMSRIGFVDWMLDEGHFKPDDIAALIFPTGDGAEEVRQRLIKHIEDDVRASLTDSDDGQEAVSDLCHELAASDAERHKEERGSGED